MSNECETPAGGRPDLPPLALAEEQSRWLAGARSRLLRRAGIAHCKRVLEVGTGWGFVAAELCRRCDGQVVALDRQLPARKAWRPHESPVRFSLGDACRLPWAAGSFDLVFCQHVLLWTAPLESALAEIARVLSPAGVAVCLEPDYGGLLEHPPEVAARELWIEALAAAGADPFVGRKIAPGLARLGLNVRAEVPPGVEQPSLRRFEILAGLPLTNHARDAVARLRRQSAETDRQFVYLPYVLVTAAKGTHS